MPDAYNPWGAPVFPTADDNAMQPETFVPQGVQQWTQQAAPKDYNILSQIAGSLGKALMYPGQVAQSKEPISTEDMVGPAFNLAGMLTLGAGAAPQEANALNMGIKAYHGSPHDFDKFDLSKIGTGEGAQAYGHGLYFADSEGVAKSYRDALAPHGPTFEGRPIESRQDFFGVRDPLENVDWRQAKALDHFQNLSGTSESRLNELRNWYRGDEGMTAAVDALEPKIGTKSKGHMYEVNINADPSHFLDWDKPLAEQHPDVLAALRSYRNGEGTGIEDALQRGSGRQLDPAEISGGRAVQALQRDLGPTGATNFINREGIPGIKYLDQGSRAPGGLGRQQLENSISVLRDDIARLEKTGGGDLPRLKEKLSSFESAFAAMPKPSSNYVVFNHDLIDIMRKYAVPGMLGAPILANALSEQKT